MIPYGRQNISDEDVRAVVEVLKSEFLTQGEAIPRFEKLIGEYVGASYAVAVNSGTSALHIACLALGVGKNDWIWTTPISFVASANCGLYCGAKVDFVDIDPTTWNMSPKALREKLLTSKKNNTLPKVVVAVHLSGLSCEMQEIFNLSKEFGFFIIEDACHALGGKYLSKAIGCCQYSDITIFSFHPVKSITTGEGGMAVTNDQKLHETMCLLRSHGITRDPKLMTQEPHGPWYYEQIELGFNYRMTDIQAALGASQLKRLNEFVRRRHLLADQYDSMLKGLPIKCPYRTNDSLSGMHLYVIRIDTNILSRSHKEIFLSLRELGVGVNLHYIPIHIQPFYRKMGFNYGDFPQAEAYYEEAISLPMFPDLTEEEQDQVVQALKITLL